MPYISSHDRELADAALKPTLEFIGGRAFPCGELAYCVTQLVLAFMPRPSYADYAAAIGVLNTVVYELYRKAVAPYEDQKAILNGPIAWR